MPCSIIDRVRPDVRAMKAYFSIRNSWPAEKPAVFLDASELPWEPLPDSHNYRLYSAQQPPELIAALADLFHIEKETLMVSRGADEAIDILIRTFCSPGIDNIIICPPAFPMYKQSAHLHGAAVKEVPLRVDFSLDTESILRAFDADTKILFTASPNNPTGNTTNPAVIDQLCKSLAGRVLVVADEAYIDFCPEMSCDKLLNKYDNLAILRSLSKGYALAGARCGALIAHKDIVSECLKVLPAYPVPVPVAEAVVKTLSAPNLKRLAEKRKEIAATRDWFSKELVSIPDVEKVYPSQGNFLLIRVRDANTFMSACQNGGYILRDQSAQPGLKNCIRLAIGTKEQMQGLLDLLKKRAAS